MSKTSKAEDPTAPKPARFPRQQRSRERYDLLLDAADALVKEAGIGGVGIYEIARRANVPPASAYHFFPSVEAVLTELAGRYIARLREVAMAPAPPDVVAAGWQQLLMLRVDRVIDFYNSNPVARRLFLAGDIATSIRKMDIEDSNQAAERVHDYLRRHYILPEIPDRFLKFSTLIGLQEGIWRIAVAQHGTITPEFVTEAKRAVLRYAETFLPPRLPLRGIETKSADPA